MQLEEASWDKAAEDVVVSVGGCIGAGRSDGDLMGQEVGKGNDVAPAFGLQHILPACLILLVKPLSYLQGALLPHSCSKLELMSVPRYNLFMQVGEWM